MIVVIPADCKYQNITMGKRQSLGTLGTKANALSLAVIQYRNENRMKNSKDKKKNLYLKKVFHLFSLTEATDMAMSNIQVKECCQICCTLLNLHTRASYWVFQMISLHGKDQQGLAAALVQATQEQKLSPGQAVPSSVSEIPQGLGALRKR